jgi:CBS-domain-containing membrane protein
MSNLPGRLGTLRARDVMTPDVIVLREADAIDEAVQTLRANHITGAPVVDGDGRFVGLLSITDLVVSDQPPPAGVHHHRDLDHVPANLAWNLFDQASPRDPGAAVERVADRMTRAVATVGLNASLVDVARIMCDGHWHRVPVVKRTGALCGIISTMDILAAVVNVADEVVATEERSSQ